MEKQTPYYKKKYKNLELYIEISVPKYTYISPVSSFDIKWSCDQLLNDIILTH